MTLGVPQLALSVRQPWAWAIIHAGKSLENRSKFAIAHMVPMCGPRAIHASKHMTREDYEDAREFMDGIGVTCPPARELPRGGIIGAVEVVGMVSKSDDPWFFGPRALKLADPQPCDFIPSVGALGYFKWKPADASIVPQLARWMMKGRPQQAPLFEARP